MEQTKLHTEMAGPNPAEGGVTHLDVKGRVVVVRGSSAISSQTVVISVASVLDCSCGDSPVISGLSRISGVDCSVVAVAKTEIKGEVAV